jgi:hypothetical protein
MKIYIAGKITGDPDYKKKFNKAEKELSALGHSVMNPACLNDYNEFSYKDYMFITQAMQMKCEAVFFLPDWTTSNGAMEEYERATKLNQKTFFDISELIGID